jgi:hypothetical protein
MKQRKLKMFKKSLIALAFAGVAVSGAANAATITSGATAAVALEGNLNANLGNSTLAPGDATAALTTTTGTAYIINDVVQFTVSGASFDTTATPTLAGGTATYNFIDYPDANTVRFRVAVADATAGDAIVFAGWSLKTAGATHGSKVTFKSSALSSNASIGAYDATATGADSFQFARQLTTTITALNGEVSTGNGRAQFTTNPNQDVLTIANTDNGGVDALTVAKAVHVVTGDFSWLMDYDAVANGGDGDGVLEAAELAVGVTDTGCTSAVATLNSSMTELTITDTGALAASCAIELNNVGNAAGGSAITAPQSFTVASTYTDAGSNPISASASAGAFTLDGSVGKTAFMPFGSAYSQSITVTNNGSVVGAITVDLVQDGVKYTKELTATSAAKSVTDISKEVQAFAAESGVTGNASVTVTTNAPGIVVEAIYYHKASMDRVLVPTTNS